MNSITYIAKTSVLVYVFLSTTQKKTDKKTEALYIGKISEE